MVWERWQLGTIWELPWRGVRATCGRRERDSLSEARWDGWKLCEYVVITIDIKFSRTPIESSWR